MPQEVRERIDQRPVRREPVVLDAQRLARPLQLRRVRPEVLEVRLPHDRRLGHLSFARTDFQAQVPDWVGIDKNTVVVLSGIVEIALGLALIVARRRRALVGVAVSVFFVAVFAGNISQFIDGDDAFGLNSDSHRRNRLFFQPLLVLWAWWSTDAGAVLRRSRRTRVQPDE